MLKIEFQELQLYAVYKFISLFILWVAIVFQIELLKYMICKILKCDVLCIKKCDVLYWTIGK